MKLGRQPKEFETAIKGLLQGVADHERFIPEVARRLADPMFTKDLHISKYALSEFVRRQQRLLVDICNNLDDDSKAALAMIYMRNRRLESPIQRSEEHTSELTSLMRSSSAVTCLNNKRTIQHHIIHAHAQLHELHTQPQ